MKTPKWLATTLSFILLALLLVAYVVTHEPKQTAVQESPKVETPTAGPAFINHVIIGDTLIQAAYASTPEEQEQGLSGTAMLAADQGMLFLFPGANQVPFWMKDMNYGLDIIWIGADKKVVDISADIDPKTFPKMFSAKVPAQYVLEVPAGFAKLHGVVVGSVLTF